MKSQLPCQRSGGFALQAISCTTYSVQACERLATSSSSTPLALKHQGQLLFMNELRICWALKQGSPPAPSSQRSVSGCPEGVLLPSVCHYLKLVWGSQTWCGEKRHHLIQ